MGYGDYDGYPGLIACPFNVEEEKCEPDDDDLDLEDLVMIFLPLKLPPADNDGPSALQ